MSVSTNIKRLRKSNKLTQDDLAEKMHVTRQAISNWETGKNQPDIETLGLLATIFGTDVSELIYGNKKGCYPRYQRKYVIYVGVCLLAIIAFVIIRVFGLPYFQEFIKKSYDFGFVGFILNYTSWVGIYMAIGFGVLSLFSWWNDCSVKKNKLYLLVAIILLLPALIIISCFNPWTAFTNFSRAIYSVFMKTIVLSPFFLKLLPCVSGIMFFVYFNNREK